MSVVVAYKWAANPAEASARADGRVDFSRARPTVSEDDPVAIELGRELGDAGGVPVVGITAGTPAVATPMATKAALARGLDRIVLATDADAASWHATQTAQVLAALVGRVGDATLVLTGSASIDENAGVVPALIAGFLGWPCLLGVLDAEATASGWAFTLPGRRVEIDGPAVASVASSARAVVAPGMRDVLAAGRRPVEAVDAGALGLRGATSASAEGADVPVVADVADVADLRVVGRRRPEARARKRVVFSGDTAPGELVDALRAEGVRGAGR